MSSTSSLLQLYSSLVRPHLEYVSQVWDPFLIKNIQKLESVQKFALRMCCKSWDSSYGENLQQSLLPELSARRKCLNLSYFDNLVNGRFEFPDIPTTLHQSAYNTCSSSTSIYAQPFAHSNYFLVLSFPKPFHYGILFHLMLCFPPLFHLLKEICVHTFSKFI